MIALFVFSFLLGFLLSLCLIPLIIKISFKKGFFDKPDERKIHLEKHSPFRWNMFLACVGNSYDSCLVDRLQNVSTLDSGCVLSA